MGTSVHHNPGSVLNSPIQATDHRDTLYSPTIPYSGNVPNKLYNAIHVYEYIIMVSVGPCYCACAEPLRAM